MRDIQVVMDELSLALKKKDTREAEKLTKELDSLLGTELKDEDMEAAELWEKSR